jgi:hypothetical protein
MRAHVIQNGIVTNTIEVESLDFMPNLIGGETGSIGWLWDGETLTPPPVPPAPVPDSVDNAQARMALIRSGISIATVDATIQAIPDAVEREIAYTQWEYRGTIRRDSELLVSLGSAIGLTSEQIDDLFRLAATL